MKNIKKTFQTIDKTLKLNRTVTLFSIFISFISVLSMGILLYISSTKDIYAIDNDGDLASMTKISKKDVFQIEADNHIRLLFSRFFSYDKSNYKENIELGLHLGGPSLKKTYELYVMKGWFDQVVSNDLSIQSEVVSSIKFKQISSSVFLFIANGEQLIKRNNLSQVRNLTVKGRIEKSPNGRIKIKNPHGLKIYDFLIIDNVSS